MRLLVLIAILSYVKWLFKSQKKARKVIEQRLLLIIKNRACVLLDDPKFFRKESCTNLTIL